MNRYRILRVSYISICILQLYLLMAHLINPYGVKKQNGAARTCKKENKKYQYQKSISLFQFKFQLEKSFVFLFFFLHILIYFHVKNILLHYIKRRKKDRLDITKLIVYFPHLIHYLYYVIHFNLIIH